MKLFINTYIVIIIDIQNVEFTSLGAHTEYQQSIHIPKLIISQKLRRQHPVYNGNKLYSHPKLYGVFSRFLSPKETGGKVACFIFRASTH